MPEKTTKEKIRWWAETKEAFEFVDSRLTSSRTDAKRYGRWGFGSAYHLLHEAEKELILEADDET